MADPADTPRALLRGLVDDAGLFPPTALSMVEAVERHRSDAIVGHPMLTHRFLCPASRWEELRARLGADDRIDVGVILDGDESVAEVRPEPDPRIRVTHYETRVRPDDLRRTVPLLVRGSTSTVYFEAERGPGWLEATAALAGARRLGAKVRCGGPHSEWFPSVAELRAFIVTCVRHAVPFKATAGLHHAVRHTDPASGLTHHGYLNLLLATAVAVDGGGDSDVDAALTEVDGDRLAGAVAGVTVPVAQRARETFVAYGSCSTHDPVADVGRLGLHPHPNEGGP